MPELRGRAPFVVTPLSAFTVGYNGAPPIIPFDKEFCFDDLGDKSVGHIEYYTEGGITTWKFVSTTQDVNNYLKSLQSTGIFDNAIAGVMSKELTYFLYNLDTRAVIFNDKLAYPDNYVYYAIRRGYQYLTGRTYNGNIVNVCDMDRTETESGSGVYVRKPSVGAILPEVTIVDGDAYIVEFFDSAKKLIERDVFYAEYSEVFVGDVSDSAISSLSVVTTRPYPEAGPNDVFLFKGENIDQLGYSVIVGYNNGDTRDVTHETDKITVTGLNTIDTSQLTETTPHVVTIEYNPGAVIGLSVTTTINVHVINDVTAEVADMVPIYYYANTLIDSLVRRYFAVMTNGSFYEITSKLTDEQPINHTNLPSTTGQRRLVETEFNLGLFDQTPVVDSYSIEAISEFSTTRIRMYADAQSTNDLYKRVIPLDADTLSLWSNFDMSEVTRDEIIPTHFRLRTIDGLVITNDIIIGSRSSFTKNANTAAIVANKTTPIIVEFFNNTSGVVITKAIVAYFN